MNLKEMVSNGKKVKFLFYKQKELWYETECGFKFPVDIADAGDGVFLNEDKAMFFMRYIRKQIDLINQEKASMENI
jgi:hypothetical protein